ncbi:MAG: hypothetical protein JNL90_15410 [Planctomycetes bacterium]|nr:hypothetical protein [Planctomycetota bacterium]
MGRNDLGSSRQRIDDVLRRELARVAEPPPAGTLTPQAITVLPDHVDAVAVVATDAGNVELRLHPLRVGFVRVASTDSDSSWDFESFVPLSAPLSEQLAFLFADRRAAPLKEAAAECGLDSEAPGRWCSDLPTPSRSLNLLRELAEWLALVAAARRRPTGTSERPLLLRDGLLRSVVLPGDLFQALAGGLESASRRNGWSVVAIAKTPPGGADFLNYVQLSMSHAASAASGFPIAFAIDDALERRFSPFSASYADPQLRRRAGRMHLLALHERQLRRPVVVEIARWDDAPAAEILAAVATACRSGFPEPGYPIALHQAHLRASVRPIEREYFARCFMTAVLRERPALRDALLAAHLHGGGLHLDPEPEARNP